MHPTGTTVGRFPTIICVPQQALLLLLVRNLSQREFVPGGLHSSRFYRESSGVLHLGTIQTSHLKTRKDAVIHFFQECKLVQHLGECLSTSIRIESAHAPSLRKYLAGNPCYRNKRKIMKIGIGYFLQLC